MKYKAEIIFTVLFIIFLILGLSNPTSESPFYYIIYLTFLIYVPAMMIIYAIKSLLKRSNGDLKGEFMKQNIIFKVLCVLIIVSLIYEIIFSRGFTITPILILILCISKFIQWLLSEED